MCEESFDVFLCHSSQDKPAVRNVGERLRAEGLNPWLDEEQLQPGLPWQRALESQIRDIRAAAVFVGDSGLGPWQEMEQEAFLCQFVKRSCPVIPVILPGCKENPELPVFLEGMTWVDFRNADPDPIQQLIWGITGERNRDNSPLILVDLGHRQDDWEGLKANLGQLEAFNVQWIAEEPLHVARELKDASVLVLPLPRRCDFQDAEVSWLRDWVAVHGRGLMLLGYYLPPHHESNANSIANLLGFRFREDLIMPTGRTSRPDCQNQAFSMDDEFAVTADVRATRHALFEGVSRLSFVSACSLVAVDTPEVTVVSEKAAVVNATARKDQHGYFRQIQGYSKERDDKVLLLAARTLGKGRVFAAGTWKLLTVDQNDNQRFVTNSLTWLSGMRALGEMSH